jgi:peptide/nickel transport system substrate-binding protein
MMRYYARVLPVVLAGALSLILAACGGGSGSTSGFTGSTVGGSGSNQVSGNADTVNSAHVTGMGTLTYVIERNIVDWNPLGSDTLVETQYIANAFDPSTFTTGPGTAQVTMNSTLLQSAKVVSTNPQVVVYQINPKAVWSNGSPITAADFAYTWQTSDPSICPNCDYTTSAGYDQVRSVKGSDDGRTVTVTFSKPFADWQGLFSPILPAYIAKQNGDNGTTAGLTKSFNTGFRYANSFPNWSGGPFIMTSWVNDQAATLVPNPKWYGPPVHLKRLVFKVITDPTDEITALQNGEVQVINPQPQVDMLQTIGSMTGVNYQIGLGLQLQSLEFNLNNPVLGNSALRRAMYTAVNVSQMVARTEKQIDPSVTPLRNMLFVPGQPYYTNNMGTLGSGNLTEAKQLLTGAGYKIVNGKLIQPDGKPLPSLVMRYTEGNAVQETECEVFQQAVSALGITVQVESTNNLGATLTHQAGEDYDILALAWFATPFTAADFYQLYVPKGGLDFGNYSDPQVTALFQQALQTISPAASAALLNKAGTLMASDAYTMPLYQMPSLLAYSSRFGNVRDNPTYFGSTYNVGEWGVK